MSAKPCICSTVRDPACPYTTDAQRALLAARQKGREWAEERWKKWQGAATPIDDDLWKEGPASLLNPTPMPALGTVEAMDAARERWAELYAERKASQPIQAPALAKETAPNFHNPPPKLWACPCCGGETRAAGARARICRAGCAYDRGEAWTSRFWNESGVLNGWMPAVRHCHLHGKYGANTKRPPVPAPVDESAQAPPVHAPVNPPQSVNCPHHGPVTERLDDEPFCPKCKVAVRWIREPEYWLPSATKSGEMMVRPAKRFIVSEDKEGIPISAVTPPYSPPYVSKPCKCGLTGGCWCGRES